MSREPRDVPRPIDAWLGLFLPVRLPLLGPDERSFTVTGSTKSTREAFLMKCLLRISFGFFLIARFSCFLMCAFWCFVSFADAGATTTALNANTTASMTPKKLRVCLED